MLAKNLWVQESVCLFNVVFKYFRHTLLRQFSLANNILLLNFISLTRFIFIFYFKNPLAFNDDFWHQFLSIWTVIFSFSFNFVEMALIEKSTAALNLCRGTSGDEGIHRGHIGLGIASFVLQLFIIMVMKVCSLQKNQVGIINENGTGTKVKSLLEIESYSFASKKTTLTFIGLFVLTIFIHIIFIKLIPNFKSTDGYVLLVYTFYPIFVSFFIAAYLLGKNIAMRKCILREIKEMFIHWNDCNVS